MDSYRRPSGPGNQLVFIIERANALALEDIMADSLRWTWYHSIKGTAPLRSPPESPAFFCRPDIKVIFS